MDIEEVDGYRGGWATDGFEVVPGTHAVGVRLLARRDHLQVESVTALRVCFAAEAGHTYAVEPRIIPTVRKWLPRVADETANAWVPSQPLAADATTCTLEPAAPVFRIAWPIGQGGLVAKAKAQRQECFQQVKARVEAVWNPIEEYGRRNPAAPNLGMRKWATVLHVRLRADGSLADLQIVVPSGAPVLDQIAVSAIQQAQPFPPPPADLVKETGVVTVPLAFEIVIAPQTK